MNNINSIIVKITEIGILNTVNTFTLVDGHAPSPPEDETFADFKRYDL